MLPLIWFRLMSWLVALFLMLCHLHLLMQTCLQMMPQKPPTRRLQVPVIAAPDLAAVLAAQDVTDVLLADVTAPLVTISLEEKALAPAAPLLRVPYLERLLEAVRDGMPLNRLPDALRPAVIQAHDDLATYITELVLALFDGDHLWDWLSCSPSSIPVVCLLCSPRNRALLTLHYGPLCLALNAIALLVRLWGIPFMVVWRPLPLEGKLDHMMPRASPGIVPYRAGLPGVQAHCGKACARHTLSLVDSLMC